MTQGTVLIKTYWAYHLSFLYVSFFTALWGRYYIPILYREIEAQGGYKTCPKAHIWEMVGSILKLQPSSSRISILNPSYLCSLFPADLFLFSLESTTITPSLSGSIEITFAKATHDPHLAKIQWSVSGPHLLWPTNSIWQLVTSYSEIIFITAHAAYYLIPNFPPNTVAVPFLVPLPFISSFLNVGVTPMVLHLLFPVYIYRCSWLEILSAAQ